MTKKAHRCLVEIDIKAVTSPGTWLPKHEDVYLSVSLFGQVRRTRAVGCTFPLHFHDSLKFDKVFESAHESATQVTEALEDFTVRINLVQLSEMFTDGRLLAYYESNARNFLYPYPSRSNSYNVRDRELLLERTVAFPGINPRLEFSTKTVIEDTLASGSETLRSEASITENGNYDYSYNSVRRSRSRTRSPSRMPTYGRHTVASATRYRSPSPILALSSQMRYLGFDNNRNFYYSAIDDRPPFVVRKVGRDLIGRQPSSRTLYEIPMDKYYRRRSIPTVTMARTGLDPYGLHYRSCNPAYMRDCESSRPCSSPYYKTLYDYSDPSWYTEGKYLRRSASPSRYLTRLRDRYDLQLGDHYWAPSHRTSRNYYQNDGQLYRNRSLERLDRTKTYHGYTDGYMW